MTLLPSILYNFDPDDAKASSTVGGGNRREARVGSCARARINCALDCFSKSPRHRRQFVINFHENLGRDLGSSCNKADRALYLETARECNVYITNDVEPCFSRIIAIINFVGSQTWSFVVAMNYDLRFWWYLEF
jgi:hypothetical protein